MNRAKLLGFLAIILLGQASVRAADERASRAFVVLVGINQYGDDNILPRPHAEADARALYDLFVSKVNLGVEKDRIRLLLGTASAPAQPATRENILKALHWLQTSAGKDDLVIFAFIGQGAPVGERVCYFAADSTFKDRAKNAVFSGDIEQAMNKLKSQRFVAFLDVNFLGYKNAKELKLDPNLADVFRPFAGKEDTKGPMPSRAIFTANKVIKPSLDLDKHGIFTQVLLEGLGGKADTDGYEPDGLVTVEELAKYVRKEVHNRAVAMGKTDAEKDQMPTIFEGPNANFVVGHNPAAYPKAHGRLVRFEKLAREQKLSRELTEEGTHLLERMPKLEAKQNLRKAYQKLADGTINLADFQAQREKILADTLISEQDAENYALMVLRAAKRVRKEYVKEVNTGQLVDSAVRGLYRHLNEKLPPAVRERLEDAKKLKEVDLLKVLVEARIHLGKREDLAKGKDVTFSLHSMLGKLDKHTDYIDPEFLVRMSQDIEGVFYGIGVQIKQNNIREQLEVVTPIYGSPAYKKKIYAGDIITKIIREVDNKGNPLDEPEVLPTKGMSTEEAVKKILGKGGTPIKIVVEREGVANPMEFTIIRGKVEVESVLGYKRNNDDSWNYVIDPENRICYIRLTQFAKNSFRDLQRAMKQLSKAGIKGFILDLRFNPGGLLDSAVKISDLFIDDGVIVAVRQRNAPETSYMGRSDGSLLAFPMVCLVNGLSASAAEIVSSCLQDHNRAIIIGTRTYGKGSVQTIHPFETGGKLKLTTATWWRPNGHNLNKASTQGREEDEWGVKPDTGFEVKLSTKELNDLQDFLRDQEIIHRPDRRASETRIDFHDRQLEAALQYLRGQIRTASKANGRKAG